MRNNLNAWFSIRETISYYIHVPTMYYLYNINLTNGILNKKIRKIWTGNFIIKHERFVVNFHMWRRLTAKYFVWTLTSSLLGRYYLIKSKAWSLYQCSLYGSKYFPFDLLLEYVAQVIYLFLLSSKKVCKSNVDPLSKIIRLDRIYWVVGSVSKPTFPVVGFSPNRWHDDLCSSLRGDSTKQSKSEVQFSIKSFSENYNRWLQLSTPQCIICHHS